jgi:hypothetical protein
VPEKEIDEKNFKISINTDRYNNGARPGRVFEMGGVASKVYFL